MIHDKASCNAACARATGNFIRALIRLALHMHGWAMWGTLGAVTLGAGVWVAWDYIEDAWDTVLDWWWK